MEEVSKLYHIVSCAAQRSCGDGKHPTSRENNRNRHVTSVVCLTPHVDSGALCLLLRISHISSLAKGMTDTKRPTRRCGGACVVFVPARADCDGPSLSFAASMVVEQTADRELFQ